MLFVRPIYTDASWTPTWLAFGIIARGVSDSDTYDNRVAAP